MLTATMTSGGDSRRCPVCGKELVIQPSWSLDDAPCPHCGCLLFVQRLAKERTERAWNGPPAGSCYDLLPDTPENHEQAAAMAEQLERLWEQHRERKRSI